MPSSHTSWGAHQQVNATALQVHQAEQILAEAASWQPRLLRCITAIGSKEELLAFVHQYGLCLDVINKATCVYRLARMFCSIPNAGHRAQWHQELLASPAFHLLLGRWVAQGLFWGIAFRKVSGPPRLRHLQELKCCHVLWPQRNKYAKKKGVFFRKTVMHEKGDSNKENGVHAGLANLLWSLAKMADPSHETMMAAVARMTAMLRDPALSSSFDAQALSNSVWALAHIRTKMCDLPGKFQELDAAAGSPGCCMAFLEALADSASHMLASLDVGAVRLSDYMTEVESKFSCQAMVNLVWSFASILGAQCACNEHVLGMFQRVRQEAIIRLHATSSALQQKQPWAYRIPGGLNEQALANMVYAFEIAELLDRELLQWIFNVAAFRMEQGGQTSAVRAINDPPDRMPAQELCTLLRAAHTLKAQPWTFLSKLAKVVLAKPHILSGWSPSERGEVNRAFALLQTFTKPLVRQQQQQQQKRHQQILQQHQQQQLAAACLLPQQQALLRHRAMTAVQPFSALRLVPGVLEKGGSHAFGGGTLIHVIAACMSEHLLKAEGSIASR
ncbi:hypothetical protein DUNSADRAFT_12319 [Dunaliella salina]|uniref:Uncharacterized protein n=1 Tax=Dunaliella salina TaxID=3046 RepID=A0ABQ7GBJ2_DUNSA|nr:hypothetical protein DUNSADRAFT_12319 [Dunaliella salina]|eukprot:KAF5831979.1 hypothetical protein DUNSADRAFT_12319 [Dunaliella salina]